MSDSDSDIILTSRDILATRLNEYISNLNFARRSNAENTVEEREKRLKNLKDALSVVTKETLLQLYPESQPVTLESIQNVKSEVEARIKTLAGRTQPVYTELRNKLVSVFEAYITQYDEFSKLELDILQHLNTDKIFELLDSLELEQSKNNLEDPAVNQQIKLLRQILLLPYGRRAILK